MRSFQKIINLLPYKEPFLFVDNILSLNEEEIKGSYTLKKDEYFYHGHFPKNPITPGVIIIEIMAQIGLVCLGIYLFQIKGGQIQNFLPAFTSTKVDFTGIARPGDLLVVNSKKIYYRFDKLKCEIKCYNETTQQFICKGEFSGMMLNKENIEGK